MSPSYRAVECHDDTIYVDMGNGWLLVAEPGRARLAWDGDWVWTVRVGRA